MLQGSGTDIIRGNNIKVCGNKLTSLVQMQALLIEINKKIHQEDANEDMITDMIRMRLIDIHRRVTHE